MIFYGHPKCSTVKKARKFLDEKNITYNYKDIVTETPNYKELNEWVLRSNIPLKKFFNTSGNLYKEMNLKNKLLHMTDEKKIELLSLNGMLIKRPLLISEDLILCGFNEKIWNQLIEK